MNSFNVKTGLYNHELTKHYGKIYLIKMVITLPKQEANKVTVTNEWYNNTHTWVIKSHEYYSRNRTFRNPYYGDRMTRKKFSKIHNKLYFIADKETEIHVTCLTQLIGLRNKITEEKTAAQKLTEQIIKENIINNNEEKLAALNKKRSDAGQKQIESLAELRNIKIDKIKARKKKQILDKNRIALKTNLEKIEEARRIDAIKIKKKEEEKKEEKDQKISPVIAKSDTVVPKTVKKSGLLTPIEQFAKYWKSQMPSLQNLPEYVERYAKKYELTDEQVFEIRWLNEKDIEPYIQKIFKKGPEKKEESKEKGANYEKNKKKREKAKAKKNKNKKK